MKLKKFLGHILTILGGVVLLIGIVAAILPNVQNRQMQLIVDSFRTPSDHWLIQGMNNGFSFAMSHVFLMILLGLVIIAAGVLLMMSARTDAQLKAQSSIHRVKTATAVATTAAATAVAAQQVKSSNAEDNPFARYLKEGKLPKSTAASGQEDPSDINPLDDEQRVNDNILSMLNEFPKPEEALFIQPVHVFNDEAYRRPKDNTVEVIADSTGDEQLTFDESAIDIEAFEPEAEEPEAMPEPDPQPEPEPQPAVAQPAKPAMLDKPRPLIRSTFRKAAEPQPVEEIPQQPVEVVEEPAQQPVDMPEIIPEAMPEPVAEIPDSPPELQVESIPEAPVFEPVEIPAQAIETPAEMPANAPVEMVAETSVEAPAAQPVPRIKSTMGRKR